MKIEDAMKQGISSQTTKNIYFESIDSTEEGYKKLLQNHVTDEDLLSVLATEHNMKKTMIKKRLEHHATLKDASGNTIGTIHIPPATKTTWEAILALQGEVPKGKRIGLQEVSYNKFAEKQMNYRHQNNGYVEQITLTTIFRRG